MKTPFFSVIIPTFNRAHLIVDTINEVLNQSFSDFELIIIDDGSNDETQNIIESINDERIIYTYQVNSGVSAARNHGALIAHCEYIVFLDSDDRISKNWLSDYYNILIAQSKSIVFSDMEKRTQTGECIKIVRARNPYGNNVDYGIFIPGSFCVKKSVFNKINGYDVSLKYGENTELSFRLFEISPSYAFTDKVGLYYYPSIDGGSKNLHNLIDSNLYIIKKHKDYFRKNKSVKRLYLQNTAVALIKLERYKEAQKIFLQILYLYPFHIKNIFRFICSFYPKLTKLVWR